MREKRGETERNVDLSDEKITFNPSERIATVILWILKAFTISLALVVGSGVEWKTRIIFI